MNRGFCFSIENILLAADLVQHFAVLGHGLNQILGKDVLHNEIPPKKMGWMLFLQGADAGGHFADVLHGLHKVLLDSHIDYLLKLG